MRVCVSWKSRAFYGFKSRYESGYKWVLHLNNSPKGKETMNACTYSAAGFRGINWRVTAGILYVPWSVCWEPPRLRAFFRENKIFTSPTSAKDPGLLEINVFALLVIALLTLFPTTSCRLLGIKEGHKSTIYFAVESLHLSTPSNQWSKSPLSNEINELDCYVLLLSNMKPLQSDLVFIQNDQNAFKWK